MRILGINSAYHESAAALVIDGELIAAVEEERCNRRKHGKAAEPNGRDLWPLQAIDDVLRQAGLRRSDLDAVAYSFAPPRRLLNLGVDQYPVDPDAGWGTDAVERAFVAALQALPSQAESVLGRPVEWHFLPHHLCHAASAYFCGPARDAAVLVVDGIAEFDTAWFGVGEAGRLRPLAALPYPHSLGLLWERLSAFLGLSAYDAAKVMGLAAYGRPETYRAAFESLISLHEDGFFRLDSSVTLRASGFADLQALFGPPRGRDAPFSSRDADLAAAIQERSEAVILHMARALHAQTGHSTLCYAGGVALNCVANGRLLAEGPFAEVYIPGAAHDAGTAIGAALMLSHVKNPRQTWALLPSPLLGPSFDANACKSALLAYPSVEVVDAPNIAAQALSEGKLVGWFQCRMEFGPRALGHRSILAAATTAEIRHILNQKIKHREDFRPFACSVLAEEAHRWFEIPEGRRSHSLGQMLMVFPVRPEKRRLIPAVVHQDGSCRLHLVFPEIQPEYHRLLRLYFERGGIPLILNTSFNDSEPIVRSPEDALRTFFLTELDTLFLGGLRVHRPAPGSIPAPSLVFAAAEDEEGPRQSLVFGNEAAGGLCPFYAKDKCWHCDIGAGEGEQKTPQNNLERLSWFQARHAEVWPRLTHLVIYNSGSVLNPVELSPHVLREIIQFAARLPRLRRISVDSREGFIRKKNLLGLAEAMRAPRPDLCIQPILGLESANPRVREAIDKKMTTEAVARAFQEIADTRREVSGVVDFGVAINLVLGLPGVGDAEADAMASVEWSCLMAQRYDLPLYLNLHPYYPSRRSRVHYPDHPRMEPEEAIRILDRVEQFLAAKGAHVPIYLGSYDEDHDQEPARRARDAALYQGAWASFLKRRRGLMDGSPDFSPNFTQSG